MMTSLKRKEACAESLMPIPVTQSGGTRATAIATPAMELVSLDLLCAKAPTIPAAMATERSIRLGLVLLRICESMKLISNS